MATLTKPDLDAMTVDERLDLLDLLHESLHDSLEAEAPPEWHKELIEERLAEAERNPGNTIPWEQVKEEMAKKWLR